MGVAEWAGAVSGWNGRQWRRSAVATGGSGDGRQQRRAARLGCLRGGPRAQAGHPARINSLGGRGSACRFGFRPQRGSCGHLRSSRAGSWWGAGIGLMGGGEACRGPVVARRALSGRGGNARRARIRHRGAVGAMPQGASSKAHMGTYAVRARPGERDVSCFGCSMSWGCACSEKELAAGRQLRSTRRSRLVLGDRKSVV